MHVSLVANETEGTKVKFRREILTGFSPPHVVFHKKKIDIQRNVKGLARVVSPHSR